MFLRYSSLLLDMDESASVELFVWGNVCGQTGPYDVAEKTPDQWVGGRVGANLGDIIFIETIIG